MRLLEDLPRKALLKQICSYAQKNTHFLLPDCDLHIQVISGETEGLYGWIAANYLLGGFDKPDKHDHGKGHHTYGFLDMGGASAQIAFAPNATEAEKHADDLQLLRMRTLDGAAAEYKVFVTTWLGFGANEARRRYNLALIDEHPADAQELLDPCLPKGLSVEMTKKGKIVPKKQEEKPKDLLHLKGTGNFAECLRRTLPLLEKDKPCPEENCLIAGTPVPAIDFDVNHFIGVSEYWHTTHEIFEMGHKDKAYDFHTYQERVNEFCSQSWSKIAEDVKKETWGHKVDETTALEVCFKASWLISILHDGIGIPRVPIEGAKTSFNGTKEVIGHAKQKGYLEPFQAINKIDGTELSWTLGRMVLYAASEVPPQEGALAVGFGSNEPGIPSDFQYGGGKLLPLPEHDDDDASTYGSLFRDSPRRIPGFLLFLAIVLVVLFFSCGRERRKTLSNKLRTLTGRGGKGHGLSKRRKAGGLGINLPSKLFGNGHHSYDRLESGEAADEFELPDMDSDNDHSDSSDGSRVGRASGWATPHLNHGTAAETGFTPAPTFTDTPRAPGTGFFDTVVTSGQGLGLSPPSLLGNRSGLTSRTESKEKLAPGGAGAFSGLQSQATGHRSRNASPTRMRSPMVTPWKESVD